MSERLHPPKPLPLIFGYFVVSYFVWLSRPLLCVCFGTAPRSPSKSIAENLALAEAEVTVQIDVSPASGSAESGFSDESHLMSSGSDSPPGVGPSKKISRSPSVKDSRGNGGGGDGSNDKLVEGRTRATRTRVSRPSARRLDDADGETGEMSSLHHGALLVNDDLGDSGGDSGIGVSSASNSSDGVVGGDGSCCDDDASTGIGKVESSARSPSPLEVVPSDGSRDNDGKDIGSKKLSTSPAAGHGSTRSVPSDVADGETRRGAAGGDGASSCRRPTRTTRRLRTRKPLGNLQPTGAGVTDAVNDNAAARSKDGKRLKGAGFEKAVPLLDRDEYRVAVAEEEEESPRAKTRREKREKRERDKEEKAERAARDREEKRQCRTARYNHLRLVVAVLL